MSGEVKTLAADRRKQDETRAALLATPAFRLAADPKAPVGPPAAVAMTPVIEFAALENAAAKLTVSAKAFDAAYAAKGARFQPHNATD